MLSQFMDPKPQLRTLPTAPSRKRYSQLRHHALVRRALEESRWRRWGEDKLEKRKWAGTSRDGRDPDLWMEQKTANVVEMRMAKLVQIEDSYRHLSTTLTTKMRSESVNRKPSESVNQQKKWQNWYNCICKKRPKNVSVDKYDPNLPRSEVVFR